MIPAAMPSEPSRWARGSLVLPLVLGLLIGAVASLDPLLSWATVQPLGLAVVVRMVPYLYSLGIALVALALGLAFARRGPVFGGDRDILLAGVAIVGMYLSGIGFGQASLTAASAVVLFAGWALQRLINPRTPWNPNLFTGLVIAFLACGFISTIGIGLGSFIGLASLIAKAMVAVLLVDTVRSMRQVRSTNNVLIWASVASAIVAVVQVAASSVWGLNFSWVEHKEDGLVQLPWGQSVQASAFTREDNGLACMLASVSLLAAVQAFKTTGKLKRAAFAAAFFVMWLAAMLTTVRGAWVAMGAGLLLLPYMVAPRRWAQWSAAILLTATLAFSSGAVTAAVHYMDSLRPSSVSSRVELLEGGIATVLDYPLKGRGFGMTVRWSPIARWGAHNTPVQIAEDLGIPATLLFLGLLVWIGVRLLWAAVAASTPLARSECLALLAGFVPLVIVMQSEPMAYGQFLWAYLALCEVGAAAAIAER